MSPATAATYFDADPTYSVKSWNGSVPTGADPRGSLVSDETLPTDAPSNQRYEMIVDNKLNLFRKLYEQLSRYLFVLCLAFAEECLRFNLSLPVRIL